jgi:hypothetical protein
MRASYRDRASATNRSERGTGSLRERSPGVWEVRVVVGSGPARARSIQRSFTVHGDAALAGKARRELVAGYGLTRAEDTYAAPAVTVGELMAASMQDWLYRNHRSCMPPPGSRVWMGGLKTSDVSASVQAACLTDAQDDPVAHCGTFWVGNVLFQVPPIRKVSN